MATYLDNVKQDLIQDEGLRLRLYVDAVGKHTIGVGRNLDADGVSRQEAMNMLNSDVTDRVQFLSQTYAWFNTLSDTRKRAFVEFCFMTGKAGFREFTNMLRAIGAGDFSSAAAEMTNSEAGRGPDALRVAKLARWIRDDTTS